MPRRLQSRLGGLGGWLAHAQWPRQKKKGISHAFIICTELSIPESSFPVL
jgi:hypothetical protein